MLIFIEIYFNLQKKTIKTQTKDRTQTIYVFNKNIPKLFV